MDDASTVEVLRRSSSDREHEADDLIRRVLTEVRRTFLTPVRPRRDHVKLIGSMDDAIDEMLAAARAIDLYQLRELLPR